MRNKKLPKKKGKIPTTFDLYEKMADEMGELLLPENVLKKSAKKKNK